MEELKLGRCEMAMKDENGDILKDKKDICDRIARFYKSLYDSNDIMEQQCYKHIQDMRLSIIEDLYI